MFMLGKRCQTIFYLYKFLVVWERSCMLKEITLMIEIIQIVFPLYKLQVSYAYGCCVLKTAKRQIHEFFGGWCHESVCMCSKVVHIILIKHQFNGDLKSGWYILVGFDSTKLRGQPNLFNVMQIVNFSYRDVRVNTNG